MTYQRWKISGKQYNQSLTQSTHKLICVNDDRRMITISNMKSTQPKILVQNTLK